jgi:ABC-type phosphate/phosphonate transport system substrate-binding protein
MIPRKPAVIGVAAVFALSAVPAAAGETVLARTAPAPGEQPLVLKIGVNDIYCGKTACECIADIAARSYDGTLAALAKQGIKLEFTYFMEVMDLEQAVRANRFDGVLCKPWTAYRFSKESGADLKRVADILDPDDKATLTGLFVVPAKSPIRDLAGLQGKRVAFGQPDAFEKYHAPLRMLAARKIKPASGIYLNSCGENLDALMGGKVDVALISDYALTASCAVDFAKPEDFRTIAVTEEIPLTSLMVDLKKVPATQAARLQQALLALAGDNVPADLTGKGFALPAPWQPEPADPAMAPPQPAAAE